MKGNGFGKFSGFALTPLSRSALAPFFSAKMSNYYCQNEFGKGFDAKDKFKI